MSRDTNTDKDVPEQPVRSQMEIWGQMRTSRLTPDSPAGMRGRVADARVSHYFNPQVSIISLPPRQGLKAL